MIQYSAESNSSRGCCCFRCNMQRIRKGQTTIMSKKSKNKEESAAQSKGVENYYDLKTDAVERLVNAKDAPEVSEKEIQKYKSGKFHIPSWLKIVFIKFWFSGAICYFFLWGLGTYLKGIDLMVVVTIGLGVAVDLMVNHLLHSLEPQKGAYDKWMFVRVRKWYSIFLNVIYAGVVLFCVVRTYNAINTLIVGPVEADKEVAFGVEPLGFGLLFMGFDMLLITVKNTFIKIVRDAEEKVSGNK